MRIHDARPNPTQTALRKALPKEHYRIVTPKASDDPSLYLPRQLQPMDVEQECWSSGAQMSF